MNPSPVVAAFLQSLTPGLSRAYKPLADAGRLEADDEGHVILIHPDGSRTRITRIDGGGVGCELSLPKTR